MCKSKEKPTTLEDLEKEIKEIKRQIKELKNENFEIKYFFIYEI